MRGIISTANARPFRRAWHWGGVLARGGVKLVFPPCCTLCGGELAEVGEAALLCAACRESILFCEGRCCRRCAAPLPVAGGAGEAGCAECRRTRLRFDEAVALGAYEGELRRAVLRSKKWGGEAVSLLLGRLLGEVHGEWLRASSADVVVPVPMHWGRRWSRGTNNADLMAGRLGRAAALPVATGALWRKRNTRPQSGLSRGRRFANVRGALRVAAGYDWKGASVLLVDDILTTGATCSEAARVLKQAGARTVRVVVAARTGGLD